MYSLVTTRVGNSGGSCNGSCINREFSLQLQGITNCNYRYLYSAANTLTIVVYKQANVKIIVIN